MAISHSLPVLKKNKVAISNDYLLERLVGKKVSFFNVLCTENGLSTVRRTLMSSIGFYPTFVPSFGRKMTLCDPFVTKFMIFMFLS